MVITTMLGKTTYLWVWNILWVPGGSTLCDPGRQRLRRSTCRTMQRATARVPVSNKLLTGTQGKHERKRDTNYLRFDTLER